MFFVTFSYSYLLQGDYIYIYSNTYIYIMIIIAMVAIVIYIIIFIGCDSLMTFMKFPTFFLPKKSLNQWTKIGVGDGIHQESNLIWIWGFDRFYPLVNIQKTIENGDL